MARDGSGVNSYKDIAKAKTIAAQPGTCSQVSLYIIAEKAGVKVSDLNVVNLAPPLFANAFASSRKSIDAAIGWAPYTIMQGPDVKVVSRSEEHTSELQSLMRISYAVFCLKKKNKKIKKQNT